MDESDVLAIRAYVQQGYDVATKLGNPELEIRFGTCSDEHFNSGVSKSDFDLFIKRLEEHVNNTCLKPKTRNTKKKTQSKWVRSYELRYMDGKRIRVNLDSDDGARF